MTLPIVRSEASPAPLPAFVLGLPSACVVPACATSLRVWHRHCRGMRHPTGFWFVFWGELAERASFYGMRTVLALYLVDVLRFGEAGAASVMSFFLAAAYLAPLLGGFLA